MSATPGPNRGTIGGTTTQNRVPLSQREQGIENNVLERISRGKLTIKRRRYANCRFVITFENIGVTESLVGVRVVQISRNLGFAIRNKSCVVAPLVKFRVCSQDSKSSMLSIRLNAYANRADAAGTQSVKRTTSAIARKLPNDQQRGVARVSVLLEGRKCHYFVASVSSSIT